MTETQLSLLQNSIHAVPNYPKPGILFRDITGILDEPTAYQLTIDLLAEKYSNEGADELVFLDITASSEQRETIKSLVISGCCFQSLYKTLPNILPG